MCGISGVIGIERKEAAEGVVRRMMAAMQHRGPDDEGTLVCPRVALGMRRLSIIDLAGGRQPIFNEAGTLAVISNGEIYNFRELRRELKAHGHVFRTRCDTEVIVHAYEQWGADCVQHLRGMFAFAVAETGPRPRVFLARDRLGIKPLYFACARGAFLFASEVRALLASGLIERRLASSALESYLLFGSVAEPAALVEGVCSLPPGHRLLVDAENPGAPGPPEAYWDFAHTATRTESPDRASAARRVRTLLEESVRLHLISDVPIGVFLSSGLDSTALAALASGSSAGTRTFTVVFPEQEFSEAELARRTAERFKTEHQELLLNSGEMLARLDEAVAALDQPSMDGINTYFVSWAARQAGLKVALSGLGSDELFGGYDTFRSTPRLARLAAFGRRVPRSLRALTAAAIVAAGGRGPRADAARKLAAACREPDALPHPYFFTRALFTPGQAAALTNGAQLREPAPEWWQRLGELARQAGQLDAFTGISSLEMRSYMAHTLLRDTDAMSMAHSLEVRVPFLDHLVVEFLAQLPAAVKDSGGRPKALLIEALADLLPAEIVAQPKRTFTFPWERWLRGVLAGRIEAGLAELAPGLQGVLDADAVRGVWREFLSGRTSWSRPWSLYVLNEWVRRHLAA